MPWSWSVRISSSPVRSPTWASRGYRWPPKLRWLILPSGVRSNSAPHASSSHTRSGASWACSSAIRQLLRNLPPRIVSPKWTCQESLVLTLRIAAAQPPSAITVWALPNSDLVTTATRRPRSRASITARNPAPPAPITTTSYWCSSSSTMKPHLPFQRVVCEIGGVSADESRIGEPPRRNCHDVEVGQHQRAQGDPGVQLVPGVELADLGPEPVPHRVFGEMLEPATGHVPAGVAGQRVHPQHDNVHQEDHVAQAESESARALVRVERDDRVVGVD